MLATLPYRDIQPGPTSVASTMNRRRFAMALATLPFTPRNLSSLLAAQTAGAISLPVALPGRIPGDGLFIRHGYCTENTWYNPGFWHTGEDWYALDGDAAGVPVLAVAGGTVVYAGSEYPGRVVIIEHSSSAAPLYSMYGHLEPDLNVGVGDTVAAGDVLGGILARNDGRAPSHLHFEIRDFVITSEVNGDAPRYAFACGYNCEPGPGYWPIDAPDHPSEIGWRNPTHLLAADAPWSTVVVASTPSRTVASLWTVPGDRSDAKQIGEVPLEPGARYFIRRIATGDPASSGTSAEAYRLWVELRTVDGQWAWVQAIVPSFNDTGSDGRPSSIRFDLLPAQ